jgi:hypothetical protein
VRENVMSNEELKAPGIKSFWVRKETGDDECAGYIVEVLSCDKVSEFDDTILVTSQRTDGDRAQIRLTLKVFHDLLFPRCFPTSAGPHSQDAGHVHVVPEIHEAKMLREQVERQKAHIRNIEGSLTARNEHIKHLECDKNLCASQLAMQKTLLEFVEAFDKIPATSIRCLGPDFHNLIDARYAIPIPLQVGLKLAPAEMKSKNETEMTNQELERHCARHRRWKTKCGVERYVTTFALEEEVVRYEHSLDGAEASLRKENFLRLYELIAVPEEEYYATPTLGCTLTRRQAVSFYELLLNSAATRAFLGASLPLGLPRADLFCYAHSGDETSTPCDHVSDLLQSIGAKLRRDREPTPQPRKDPDQ